MSYDESLANRVRNLLADHPGYSERKMFGGLCFMINGNMCCGIVGDELMLRLGGTLAESALEEPHTRPMDFTGRPMRSMVYVEPEGISDPAALKDWVERAARFAATLPSK